MHIFNADRLKSKEISLTWINPSSRKPDTVCRSNRYITELKEPGRVGNGEL